jgi:MtN3 and saliva related transmembrane protein
VLIKIVGFCAIVTTVISLIPQIIRTHKTHSVEDVSLWMLIDFLLNAVLWIVYGVLIGSREVLVANILMGIFSVWLLVLKFYYGK